MRSLFGRMRRWFAGGSDASVPHTRRDTLGDDLLAKVACHPHRRRPATGTYDGYSSGWSGSSHSEGGSDAGGDGGGGD